MDWAMNPKYGELLSSGKSEPGEKPAPHKPAHKGGGGKHPHMAIHSHAGGHEVHITHPSGEVESHHHELGDAEGLKAHIDQHFGGGEGSAPEGHEQGAMGGEPALAGER